MIRRPDLIEGQNSTLMTTTFKGYNHNEIIEDGEMFDMKNLSGDGYPLLTQRKKRGITTFEYAGEDPQLHGIHGGEKLTLILGTKVYYNFTEVSGITVSESASMLPKKIVSMGAYVCIWPDKVYFNTVDLSDCGSMERNWDSIGNGVSLTMCRGDGTNYDMTQITVSSTAPTNPTNGQLWIDQSGSNDVLKQYDSTSSAWVEVATTYIKVEASNIGVGLAAYDTIELKGLTAQDTQTERVKKQVNLLNGYTIVYGVGVNYIMIAGLISQTQSNLKNVNVSADRLVPDLDYICESNNRLWGCRYGLHDGKIVNEIKACKLGDFKNWNSNLKLSTDSYTMSVGTEGKFTAAVTQRGYPVFFKEDCIIRISGQTPSSFQQTTTMCRGVQDGSWRSVCVVNEAIYYKSRREIMMYDGSMPMSVSDQLGLILYSDARAGALNGKYYISMKDTAGDWTMFAYDTNKAMWHKEDDFRAMGFGRVGDELFAIDETNNKLDALMGTWGEPEEEMEWSATFGLFGTDYRRTKYLSRFKIRMYIEPDSKAHLWIMYDSDGDWHDEGEIRGHSMKTFDLPVVPRRCDHLRFRLTGDGECRIYSISRLMEVGGDG